MSMPKYLMLTWTAAEDEYEFMNYIENLKKEHDMKITIQEDKTHILYFGENPEGKELYGIEKKEINQG